MFKAARAPDRIFALPEKGCQAGGGIGIKYINAKTRKKASVPRCLRGWKNSTGEKAMEIKTVKIEKPEDINFILGQSHFIKTVEDIHEVLVGSVPGIKFGLAFCEASGKCLIRWTGTDDQMIELAKKNALAIGAGHSFILFLGQGFFPINVLNAVKSVPEVACIFCATANPTEVLVAETEQGRGILGVVDGFSPKGVEDEEGIQWRKGFLRMIGYKS
jgi:adenosine/AMP kinase